MKRSPLCGRNFEYFAERSLSGRKMAAAYMRVSRVRAYMPVQSILAVNSQEERRMAMNAVVDERTLFGKSI